MFGSEFLISQNEIWPGFISATLKGTVMLASAGLLSICLRRRSAAIRHSIWCAALFSLAFFLIGANGFERWQVPVLPLASVEITSRQAPVSTEIQPEILVPATSAPTQSLTEDVRGWLGPTILSLWLLGVLLVLARLVVGTIRVRRLVRRGTLLTDPSWATPLQEISTQLRLKRPVTLVRSEQNLVPATCGVFSAAVLLPYEAEGWSADRRRIVLLHELIHVKRRDLLTQTIAQIVCAFYWFNPLVWVAMRQTRKEQEWACDEQVMTAGIKASDYAAHLLEIGRGFSTCRVPAATMTAIVHRSQLERRLCAILKPGLHSSNGTGIRVSSSLILCLVFISLAATGIARRRATVSPQDQRAAQQPIVPPDTKSPEKSQPAQLGSPNSSRAAKNDAALPTEEPVEEESQAAAEQTGNEYSPEERSRLASNGITAGYIDEMARAGYRNLTVAQLIALYTNAVRSDYVASLASLGYSELSPADLIALRSNGITAAVIESFQAVKYADFQATNYIAFRSNGVTPAYLKSLSALGYDKLTPRQIVDLWVAGVTPDFVRNVRLSGQTNLSPKELILLKTGEKP